MLSVLFLFLLPLPLTTQPDEANALPLRLVAGRPVAAVTINGKGPFDLIVDTGAAATVLNGDLADELGLASEGAGRAGDPAGGAGIEIARHTLSEIRVGGATVTNVRAVSWRDENMIQALGGARGVLGVPSLQGNLVTFDFAANRLTIEAGALTEGDGSLPYFAPIPIPSLEVVVAGESLEGHLDTGNGGGLFLPIRLKDQLTFAAPLQSAKGRTASGEFDVLEGELDGEVTVAGIAIRNPQVRLGDRFSWANIGRGAMEGLVLTVDAANRRIRLAPSPGAKAGTADPQVGPAGRN